MCLSNFDCPPITPAHLIIDFQANNKVLNFLSKKHRYL